MEVGVGRREAAGVVDESEEVSDRLGFSEERLKGVSCRAEFVCQSGSLVAICDAIEYEVGDSFTRVATGRAAGGVRFGDAVEVVVQRRVSSA